jgi:transposase
MANKLKMAMVQAIQQLLAANWSQRRIARQLGIDRGTVARFVQSLRSDPNAAISPAGSDGSNAATFPGPPAPGGSESGRSEGVDFEGGSKAAISPAGSDDGAVVAGGANRAKPAEPGTDASPGRRSDCEAYRDLIQAKLDQGLSAQRIFQDLVGDHQAQVSYDSVKRFVRRLGAKTPLPFRRMECAPGEEAQVDFGTGAPLIDADGKRRKTYVFRIVLSHSRKAYSEATRTQTAEDFFRCLENAFAHFGGVPQTLVIDNLKAAVAHPDWFDPELTPKVQAFCQHYGTVILPTKPYTPRHKGKIESGVKYVKNNALKARTFQSLEEQNQFLLQWEQHVADRRIHGTTKQQVGQVFLDVERKALAPLARERFPHFHEARRKVNRDGHVEVAKAYYSAPPEYLGREVWVRWDARLVRIFNSRFEQIAMHVRHEPGRFSTQAVHVANEKISGVERGASWLLSKVSVIGPHTSRWSQALLHARGIEGTRVLQGLLSLTQKHASEALENACEIALSHGCFRLRTIRQLLTRQAEKQQPLPFLDEHPIIRPLDDYAAVVTQALRRREDRSSMSEGFLRHDRTEPSLGCMHEKSRNSPEAASCSSTDLLPPRSGYPSSGCASAEPDSVSPDVSSLVALPSLHYSPQEKSPDE